MRGRQAVLAALLRCCEATDASAGEEEDAVEASIVGMIDEVASMMTARVLIS